MKSLAEALNEHQMNPHGQHDGWWECTCGEPYNGAHLVAAMNYEQAGDTRKAAITAAAQAIYIADEENPEPDWDTLPKFGKRHYKRLAEAAYESITQSDLTSVEEAR